MIQNIRSFLTATLFLGAAVLSPPPAWSGSCCGGSGGSNLVLPKIYNAQVDVSFDWEHYDGFWDQNERYVQDPPGSDLDQYRLTAGYARRLAPRWQASVAVPYVLNENHYSGLSSRSYGLGDIQLSLWYEALDDLSAWKVRSVKDLVPSVLIGPSLLVPAGISPYDEMTSSFDVTGRGFYRLDGNIIVTKTLHPLSASFTYSYGTYLDRAVNREYGKYVEPYRKDLGNRSSAALTISYIAYPGSAGDTLTAAANLMYIAEEDATINGSTLQNSGFRKNAVGASLAYSSTDHDWGLRAVWNHALKRDGKGKNFPTTDIITLGVSYGFR